MAAIKLNWSSLLQLTELDFVPEPPKVLKVSDELLQSLSWLTGATRHDRKLLRCNESGVLLVGDAWSLFGEVETDELYPESGSPDSFIATVENKGVLIASSDQLIRVTFIQVAGGDYERVYVSPNTLYWYPHKTYSVTVNTVPDPGGTASYVGVTAFN